jgi:hypothetical protein
MQVAEQLAAVAATHLAAVTGVRVVGFKLNTSAA